MGCSSSKRSTATVDTYSPPPSSFDVFNINAIDEPWVKVEQQAPQENSNSNPVVVLEKLNNFETETPYSWDEVSKPLEDLKPTINNNDSKKSNVANPTPPSKPEKQVLKNQPPSKNSSFHTLEELEAKLSPKPAANILRKTESVKNESETKITELKPARHEGFKSSVKENIFIALDRQAREKEGRMENYDKLMTKRDPLSEFPEMCPPGGADSVVIYTTSLRGVRRTYDDCEKITRIFEAQHVVFDERDVSLHGEFLNELMSLLGEGVSVPRVFVKGRYLGGAEEVSELNELGKLGKILRMAGAEKGLRGWRAVGESERGSCRVWSVVEVVK